MRGGALAGSAADARARAGRGGARERDPQSDRAARASGGDRKIDPAAGDRMPSGRRRVDGGDGASRSTSASAWGCARCWSTRICVIRRCIACSSIPGRRTPELVLDGALQIRATEWPRLELVTCCLSSPDSQRQLFDEFEALLGALSGRDHRSRRDPARRANAAAGAVRRSDSDGSAPRLYRAARAGDDRQRFTRGAVVRWPA